MSDATHHAHCNQGDYEGACKYGYDDCPTLFPAPAVAAAALASRFFDEEAPFSGVVFPGDNRLVVIVGENASGKSLLFRIMSAFAKRDHSITGITISIRERTGSGTEEMSRMRQAFMFGNEQTQSTGAASANVVINGFKNANNGDHGRTFLMLDEPELGLSDGYAKALGELITGEVGKLAPSCAGVVVVTHNRALVAGLLAALKRPPTFVYTGDNPVCLDDWLVTPEPRSVADLLNLRTVALERFRATQQIFNARDE